MVCAAIKVDGTCREMYQLSRDKSHLGHKSSEITKMPIQLQVPLIFLDMIYVVLKVCDRLVATVTVFSII